MFDEEVVPEELTQIRMGKIIKDKVNDPAKILLPRPKILTNMANPKSP